MLDPYSEVFIEAYRLTRTEENLKMDAKQQWVNFKDFCFHMIPILDGFLGCFNLNGRKDQDKLSKMIAQQFSQIGQETNMRLLKKWTSSQGSVQTIKYQGQSLPAIDQHHSKFQESAKKEEEVEEEIESSLNLSSIKGDQSHEVLQNQIEHSVHEEEIGHRQGENNGTGLRAYVYDACKQQQEKSPQKTLVWMSAKWPDKDEKAWLLKKVNKRN